MSFQGKTAVVTGGGSGIGRATALLLAREGANVIIGNRNADRGEEVVRAIKEQGGQATFRSTDVAKPGDVRDLVAHAVDTFGGLDLAFNNSGMEGEIVPLHEQGDDATFRLTDVNVNGVFYSMKYEVEEMLKRGGGSIVNNSSVVGLKGAPNFANYVASKHAVTGLTKAAALDYAKQGIRINAVAPGPIETRMLTSASGGDVDAFAQFVPMGRVGRPEDIAEAVVWLLSDKAGFVTGATLSVDGGWGAT